MISTLFHPKFENIKAVSQFQILATISTGGAAGPESVLALVLRANRAAISGLTGGERRAQAVRRALMLQGAADSQLSTVSYGEERPAAAGSDESAWTQNRRVEIVYLQ